MTKEGLKVAITTGSRDRLEHLCVALNSWTALSEVDSIVVVDWSSAMPVFDSLERHDVFDHFKDPRLVVVRVNGRQHWENSLCHNLEIQVASHLGSDLVLRLDNDVVLDRSFFAKHPVDGRSFYAVDCHLVPPEADDKRNLCGIVYAHTKHLCAVGGYNERLTQYGYEDEDLYERLVGSGLTWKRVDLDTATHLPHPDSDRLRCVRLDPTVERIFPRRAVESSPRAAASLKKYLIEKSKAESLARPWGKNDQRARWQLIHLGSRYLEATPC